MAKRAAETEEQVLNDGGRFSQAFFRVRSKEKAIVRLIFNPVQRHYWLRQTKRDIVLKARQLGLSTVTLARFLYDTIRNPATDAVTVGHEGDAMRRMLANAKLMLDSVPPRYRPISTYNNKDELYFGQLDSRYWIGTFRGLGRSGKINDLHMTEVAFWEMRNLADRVQGYLQSVPWGGNIAIESTPNGAGGWFYRQCKMAEAGESEYRLHVYPWYCNPEYAIPRKGWAVLRPQIAPRFSNGSIILDDAEIALARIGIVPEQLVWRRHRMFSMGDMRMGKDGCLRSRLFSQEFECDFVASGQTVFDPEMIFGSCHWKKPRKGRQYVHGCDTALGVPGGAFSVIETLDRGSGDFVAQVRGRWKPAAFAERVHAHALRYPGLVMVESNNTGHAVLLRLEQLFFEEAKKIRSRSTKKKNADPLSMEEALQAVPYRIYGERNSLGWNTNEQTRQIMLSDFDMGLGDGSWHFAVEDIVGMAEARAWIFGPTMKAQAPSGEYDDTILAKMLAVQAAKAAIWGFYFGRESGSRAWKV